MSARLSIQSTLRGLTNPLKRAFSTTTPAAQEDSNGASQQQQRQSTNSSLLSLNRGGSSSSSSRRNSNNNHSASHKNDDGSTRSSDAASRILSRYRQQGRADSQALQATQDRLREQKVANDYLREMPRRWKTGDVYAPHDLSPVEMQKFRRRRMRQTDIIDVLGIRPQDMYKNFSMIREFTNPTGQILSSKLTGLRPVNQRKVAKMVRRAIGMGIYPSVHDHPEMIRDRFFPQPGDSGRR